MSTSHLKAALMSVLRDGRFDASSVDWKDESSKNLRSLLGDVLIASDAHWRADTLALIDQMWKEESDSQTTVPVKDLPILATTEHGTNISLWQGDITKLQGNSLAIVNAANDQGLGCFVPRHKCIDNIIHRQAGPRLRMECQTQMKERGAPLSAGTLPIATSGYFLPSSHVIHVTGPQVDDGGTPTQKDCTNLRKAYELSLDAAEQTDGINSIAFPCISTGIFGFPQEKAVDITLSAVHSWLETHPSTSLERVVFNVFTDKDFELYQNSLQTSMMQGSPNTMDKDLIRTRMIDLAKQWIDDADAVLICAGAGMSVKEGEMVYTNPDDFALAYPWFPKWGYKTSYDCMGLMSDNSVPLTAKWALQAKHMDNMRWTFTPNDGYQELLGLVNNKEYFVLTSNVDACFERSGFSPDRIYTPQGEWTYLQCMNACRPDSVFDARPYIDNILPHISEDGYIPRELVPSCPRCGKNMFGNVRGGDWFLHHQKYNYQSLKMQKWMEKKIDDGSNVVILEIGAGFNTPTVTRLPVESFAREVGNRARFIRINPTEAAVPEDLKAISLEEGWQVLADISRSPGVESKLVQQEESRVKQSMADLELLVPDHMATQYHRYFGHFDWRQFLHLLRR